MIFFETDFQNYCVRRQTLQNLSNRDVQSKLRHHVINALFILDVG